VILLPLFTPSDFPVVHRDATLFPSRDFLRGHGALPRALARARIGVRALSVHRQIATVTNSAVALNFNQPPDVHLNFLAEIAFDAAFRFDGLTDLVNLFFGQILDLFGVVNIGFRAELARANAADTVDRGEADEQTLVDRKIYTCNTCHTIFLLPGLALALLVLRVDANHAHHTAPVDHLALVANLFY
jgi:hypothetical protein